MKIVSQLCLLLIISASSELSYAAWRQTCLDDCFTTGHECQYCDYQCHVDEYYTPGPVYSNSPCPLEQYSIDHYTNLP